MAKHNAITFTAYARSNGCFKEAKRMPKGSPAGIIVHSTGCNNPRLSRYVNSPEICGENIYRNWYDRPDWEACPHAVIGKDKNGEVRAAKLLPYNICCWNAGQGDKGSYNYSPAYIQFEICEDALDDPDYFAEAFVLAAKLCARLMKSYGIPLENVISHKEAHARGYACNHGDPENWLSKFGRDMDWFRVLVAKEADSGVRYTVTGRKTVSEADLLRAEGQLKALGFDVSREKIL